MGAVLAVQTVIGAVVLLGYVYRRMQNHSIAVWTASRFVGPRWLAAEQPTQGWRRYAGSLANHAATGVSATLSLAVLVLPSAALMAFSWYAGWNNSFYKGYEHAAVGPLLGLTGIGVGLVVMTYLPYAQARHALTGDWRMFFNWRQNLLLIGMRPFANILLPTVYACTGLAVAGARGLLTFVPQMPAFQSIEQDPAGFLGSWFFWWGVPFVILFFLTKRIAARLYARALLRALRGGHIAHGELHDAERYYIRGALGTATARQSRGLANTLVRVLWPLVLWFPMFAVLYAQQFVNYLGVWGWLNHPLVLVPVLAYSP